MKKIFFSAVLCCFTLFSTAQDKFFTKTGKVQFDATTSKSPEKVVGINKTAVAVLDKNSGAIQFSVLLKGFEFEQALMEEHFNENYVESHKYPKTEFRGIIVNNKSVNYQKDGSYPVKVKGKMSLHGVVLDHETDGTLSVKAGKIELKSNIELVLTDYKIDIPGLVADKLSKTAKISIYCLLEPLKQ